MTVKWKNKTYLSQESNVFEMCLLKKVENDFEAITVPVMCKDFFQDSFFIAHNIDRFKVDECSVYSYKVNKKESNLDELMKDRLYLAIRKTDSKTFNTKQIQYSQAFMNYYDSLFNKPSTTVMLSDDKKSLVFEYSKEWTDTLYMLSLFTLLSRCSTHCDTTEVNSNYIDKYKDVIGDKDYKNKSMFVTVQSNISKLLKGDEPDDKFKYSMEKIDELNMYSLHHSSGIISLTFNGKTTTKKAEKAELTV